MIQASNKILVPIDFSEQSLIALEQSYNLAREYHAEITLLNVIEEGGMLAKFFSNQQHDDLKPTLTMSDKSCVNDASIDYQIREWCLL